MCESVTTITRNACISPHQTGFVGKGSDHLQLAVLRPRERSLRRGENFWLRLTTASAQCLRLFERYFHYTYVIRPVLEYPCPAWHTSLTKEQTKQIEVIQKCALRTIFNSNCVDYKKFYQIHHLQTLADRQSELCKSFFKKNVLDEASCLRYLLPTHVLLRTIVYDISKFQSLN